MATAVYRCPSTLSLGLHDDTTGDLVRVRPNELFALDDADAEQVALLLDAGFDIGEYSTDEDITEIGDVNDWIPHNPFHIAPA